MDNYGILSIAPAMVALVLAFVTKDALFSILIGIFVGVSITGNNIITGFTAITQTALGNGDFVWVVSIEVFIGVMIAFFQKSGAIQAFSNMIVKKNFKRRGAQVLAWLLGIFIFFSDYFSPLYVGTVMRGITDKAKVSREKLAYICDSTSAPIITLIPFSAWGIYMAGLIVGIGPIVDKNIAQTTVIKMIPYNFYGFLATIMVGLIATGVIPDFGPMKKAEERAYKEGKPVRDGANPLLSGELDRIQPNEGVVPHLFLDFFLPALIIISITIGTYIILGSAKTLEAFICAVFYQFISMIIRKMAKLEELMKIAVEGIKSVMSAILILAMAYCLNAISKELGTANYIISITQNWMTPVLLVALTFLVCGFVSFFTGTSWGTYAIMAPICVTLAFAVSGGKFAPIVYATIAAVMGGGCFGDHCSPLSDTTILSSLAAGADHVDHVKTQIPYTFLVGVITCIGYIIVGIVLS